ncbi:hypothetical protein [Gracilibacillus sp. JCM 18860]
MVSHNGAAIIAKPVESAAEILSDVTEDMDVIGIDEIQFLTKKLWK